MSDDTATRLPVAAAMARAPSMAVGTSVPVETMSRSGLPAAPAPPPAASDESNTT